MRGHHFSALERCSAPSPRGFAARARCERLMAEMLKTTAELTAVREAAARIAGELAAFQARPWWRRLVTSFSPVLGGAGLDAQNACAVVASGTAT